MLEWFWRFFFESFFDFRCMNFHFSVFIMSFVNKSFVPYKFWHNVFISCTNIFSVILWLESVMISIDIFVFQFLFLLPFSKWLHWWQTIIIIIIICFYLSNDSKTFYFFEIFVFFLFFFSLSFHSSTCAKQALIFFNCIMTVSVISGLNRMQSKGRQKQTTKFTTLVISIFHFHSVQYRIRMHCKILSDSFLFLFLLFQ